MGELFFFARFRALPGREPELERALREVVAPSRKEAGCRMIQAFRSLEDARLFYIHSVWRSEAAFEAHGKQPHTAGFLRRIEPLLVDPPETARTNQIL